MADNTVQTGADSIATDDVTTLNGSASSGVKVQRVKVLFGDDNTARDVSSSFPLPVADASAIPAGTNMIGVVGAGPAATGTITSPALALTSFTVLASNAARKMATFYNDSVNVVYLALAATASTTAYTVQIPAGGYYELPGSNTVFTGLVTAIALTATGNVRVTELT